MSPGNPTNSLASLAPDEVWSENLYCARKERCYPFPRRVYRVRQTKVNFERSRIFSRKM